jgi:SAUR family protein
MAILGSRKQCTKAAAAAAAAASASSAPWYAACVAGGDSDADAGTTKVPKGYFPVMLVDGELDDEEGQRILVPVKMLREPCMAALLELAEEQFGHGQRGVLRIPCTAAYFEHVIVNGLTKNDGGR